MMTSVTGRTVKTELFLFPIRQPRRLLQCCNLRAGPRAVYPPPDADRGYRFSPHSRGEVSLHGDKGQSLPTPEHRIVHAPDRRGDGAEGNFLPHSPESSARRGWQVQSLAVPGPQHHIDKAVIISAT
jgi:hypothetical protein